MPHPFKTLTEANEAYAALSAESEGRIEAAQAQAKKNCEDMKAAQAQVEDLTAKLDASGKEVETLKSSLATKEAEFDAYKADEPKRLNAELAREIAKAGQAPLDVKANDNANGDATGGKTLTREAFRALNPYDRMKFMRDGGKLSD